VLEIGAKTVAQQVDIAVLRDRYLQRPLVPRRIGCDPSNRLLGLEKKLIETFPLGGVASGRLERPVSNPWMGGICTKQKIHCKIVFVRRSYFKRNQNSNPLLIFFQSSVDPAPEVDIGSQLAPL